MTEAKDVLAPMASGLDLLARTPRGWVAEVATVFAAAARVAEEFFAMGSDAEEVRALIEDLRTNKPKKIGSKDIHDDLDKWSEERRANEGKPPKVPK